MWRSLTLRLLILVSMLFTLVCAFSTSRVLATSLPPARPQFFSCPQPSSYPRTIQSRTTRRSLQSQHMETPLLASRASHSAVELNGRLSLQGISRSSHNDMWVVGSLQCTYAPTSATYIEQGNASFWHVVPSPDLGGSNMSLSASARNASLQAIAALGPKNAWAVGTSLSNALIEHWNGLSWQIVASPSIAGDLEAVTALAPDDVWAVGEANLSTLVEHWDGRAWQIIASPNEVANSSSFSALAAISKNDIWAVGFYWDTNYATYSYNGPLIAHWDGKLWQLVTNPYGDWTSAALKTIFALDAKHVWATGWTDNGPLIEFWNGTHWSIVPDFVGKSPMPFSFSSVALLGKNAIWAIGTVQDQTLLEYWDGKHWSVVSSPKLAHFTSQSLQYLSAANKDDIWVTGSAFSPQQDRSTVFLEHWDGQRWKIVSCPQSGGAKNTIVGIDAHRPKNAWLLLASVLYPPEQSGSVQSAVVAERWNGRGWQMMPSSWHAPVVHYLNGISAVNAQSLWVVGVSMQLGQDNQTYIQHWNGRQWQTIPGANRAGKENVLTAVSVHRANDIWAAGYTYTPSFPSGPWLSQTLIEHWDGRLWKIIPSPNVKGALQNQLKQISADRTDDAWAIGGPWARGAPQGSPLLEHWDGRAWCIVPPPPQMETLTAIRAVTPQQVWVGGTLTVGNAKTTVFSLWDGTRWQTQVLPVIAGTDDAEVTSLQVSAPNDIWAVGWISFSDVGPRFRTLALHWDGRAWHVVPSPNSASTINDNQFFAVDGEQSTDLWAVGISQPPTTQPSQYALLTRWDGHRWRIFFSPHREGWQVFLQGVVGLSEENAWVVGYATSSQNGDEALIEHWNGTSWHLIEE